MQAVSQQMGIRPLTLTRSTPDRLAARSPPAALRVGSTPTQRSGPHLRRHSRAVRAISYPEDQLFGPHGIRPPQIPARDMSEEEKRREVENAAARIRDQTQQRSERLKKEAHLAHLDHELKFGKLMFSQGSFDSALAHFNKVVQGSQADSYHRGEATLQKAACLEKLGRESEARALYESLVQFRAPYPNIKRRAAQALFGGSAEGKNGKDEGPRYDEYMYRMFDSGFGSYMPKEKYVETKEEKVLLSVLPWAMLLMAPLLLVSLFLFPK